MRKNEVYTTLKNEIGLDVRYEGHINRCSEYMISYDIKKLIENWGTIIKKIKGLNCCKNNTTIYKIKEDISSYSEWVQWNNDKNLLTMGLWITNSSSSKHFSYEIENNNEIYILKRKFFEKMLDIENIEKYKKPILFFIEKNGWERETWRFGIDLKRNINKLQLIIKFYDRLSNFKPIDQKLGFSSFRFQDSIEEYENIRWESHNNYMLTPIYLDGILISNKIEELIEKDDDYLLEALYKGYIREFIG